jgi:hypothetical protein
MFDLATPESSVVLTLHTDSYVVRGAVRTRQRRLIDVLNRAEDPFLVLENALLEEYGAHGDTIRAEFAQVNLATVLFAVTDEAVATSPELRTPKTRQEALVTLPTFKLTGTIHLLPERDLRLALHELTGHFIPLTEATYWSDAIGEARATAAMVAFNHDRAQILAPHQVVDPWAGLDRDGPAGASGEQPI